QPRCATRRSRRPSQRVCPALEMRPPETVSAVSRWVPTPEFLGGHDLSAAWELDRACEACPMTGSACRLKATPVSLRMARLSASRPPRRRARVYLRTPQREPGCERIRRKAKVEYSSQSTGLRFGLFRAGPLISIPTLFHKVTRATWL